MDQSTIKKALWKWLLCCVQSGLTAAFVMETCQKQPLLLCSCVIPVILRLLQFVLFSYSLAKIALYVYNLACAFSKPIHLLMVSGSFFKFLPNYPQMFIKKDREWSKNNSNKVQVHTVRQACCEKAILNVQYISVSLDRYSIAFYSNYQKLHHN